MSRAPSFCGVILAAGESTRMGRDKALLPWPKDTNDLGETFLSAAIRSLAPLNDLVIVVVGNNQASIAPVIYASGAFLIRNPAPERGQFSSLQTGLQEVLNHGRDAAMVTLVDRPPVHFTSLQKLRIAFEAVTSVGKWAVIPEYAGKHGHPILLGRELIEEILKAPPTWTAREIEHRNQDHIQYVPLDDARVCTNINTPQDYANLSSSG